MLSKHAGHLCRAGWKNSSRFCRNLAPVSIRTYHSNSDHHDSNRQQWGKKAAAAFVTSAGMLSAVAYSYLQTQTAECRKRPKVPCEPGAVMDGLPTYKMDDVKKHNNRDNGIWVIYKNGVYDITKFVDSHPGGDKILLASGDSVEPFFNLFSIHKTKEVMGMLEGLRIGNITELPEQPKTKDAYENDPNRSPILTINSPKPFNAEPPRSLIINEYITPNEIFFVRNHLPVPIVNNIKSYKLEGAVEDRVSSSLLLSDLKKLPQHTITATLQCAGNRRSEMSDHKTVKGLMWSAGSISTARWTGARLVDVLKHLGYNDKDFKQHKYVQFEGMDKDPTGTPYGSSILTEKAIDPQQEILVAHQMNGEEIPLDHGYPLRVIIPGVVGARNVKWLNRIVLSNDESKSHWQRNDYKSFNPSIDFGQTKFDESYPIQETPVQSAICEPLPGSTISRDSEFITIRGYAYSGGGKSIIRVDLSLDGGKTWFNPELESENESPYRAWAWTLWEATIPIPKDAMELNIVCKAVDSQHNVQPESADGIWNVRGLLNTSWHRVNVSVK